MPASQPARSPSRVLAGVLLFGLAGSALAACPLGTVLSGNTCVPMLKSASALCSYQVASANPQLSPTKPADKEKLNALMEACIKNYEQAQAQATRSERQTTPQAPLGRAAVSPGGATLPGALGAPTSGAARTALPAVQAAAPQINPTAAAKPVADMALACTLNTKGMKPVTSGAQVSLVREYEVIASNHGTSSIPSAFKVQWTAQQHGWTDTGMFKLRAPLAANATLKVGTVQQPAQLPVVSACKAFARL